MIFNKLNNRSNQNQYYGSKISFTQVAQRHAIFGNCMESFRQVETITRTGKDEHFLILNKDNIPAWVYKISYHRAVNPTPKFENAAYKVERNICIKQARILSILGWTEKNWVPKQILWSDYLEESIITDYRKEKNICD